MLIEDRLRRNSGGFRYSVELKGPESIEWCTKTFGPQGRNNSWWTLQWTIQFKNQEDKMLYLLRWGGE